MPALTDQQLLELAVSYHRAGRVAESENIFGNSPLAYPQNARSSTRSAYWLFRRAD